jgi:hypothetical protein
MWNTKSYFCLVHDNVMEQKLHELFEQINQRVAGILNP